MLSLNWIIQRFIEITDPEIRHQCLCEAKRMTLQGIFSISGEAKILNFFTVGQASVTYMAPYFVRASGSGYYSFIWGEVNLAIGNQREAYIRSLCGANPTAECRGSANSLILLYSLMGRNFDVNFYGSISASLKIPDGIPIVGGKKLAGVSCTVTDRWAKATATVDLWPVDAYVSVKITFANPVDVDWSAGLKSTQNDWETPFNQPYILNPETGDFIPFTPPDDNPSGGIRVAAAPHNEEPVAIVTFLDNWTLVDKATTGNGSKPFALTPYQEPVTTLTIPPDAPLTMIRLNYENPNVGTVEMTVTGPSGQVFNECRCIRIRSAYILLDHPEAGDYTVSVANAAELGNLTVEALVVNEPPQVVITDIQPTANPGVFEVKWEDHDHENNAVVAIYLESDREGADGFLVGVYDAADDADVHLIDTSSFEHIPSGEYYVMVEIDDGVNAPQHFYSDVRIPVYNPHAPSAVTGLAIAPGNQSFTISWDKVDDPSVTGYTILYTEHDDLGNFEHMVAVPDPAANRFTVSGLENGKPLLVTVVSVDEDLHRSHPVEVLRVVPHESNGTTLASAMHDFPPFAEVGVPLIENAGIHHSGRLFFNPVNTTVDLLNAPSGMMIDIHGTISWTPTADQIGEHTFIIRHQATFANGETETVEESVTIEVHDPEDVHGVGNTAHDSLPSGTQRSGGNHISVSGFRSRSNRHTFLLSG